jgi:tetratricopeptide (TPR) repeat protein
MRKIFLLSVFLIVFLVAGGKSDAMTYYRLDAPEFDISRLARIAVLPFDSGLDAEIEGKAVADRLSTHLAQEGILRMVERIQIEKVIDEGKFSRADFSDPQKAAEFGKLVGADAVVIGRIDSSYREVEGFTYIEDKKSVLDINEIIKDTIKEESKNKDDKTVVETQRVQVKTLEKSGDVNIVAKVVDVETGRIIASKVAYHNWKKRGVDEPEINALPPKGEILEDCTSKCMDQLIRAFSPHKVVIERELRPKSHASEMEMKAIGLAESGYVEEAIKIFEDLIAKVPKKNDIRGNLAICYEAVGDFEKADYWLHEAVLNGKTTHDLWAIRQSMLNAWYFTQKKSMQESPIIVLDVIGDKVYIDGGLIRGIETGDKLKICRETIIKHPVTGDLMGRDNEEIAAIEIVEVQDLMAIAKVVSVVDPGKTIQKLDVAIPEEKESE